MSYLAHIAYENADGTYDLYTSHNGGEEFYLTPYLQQVAAGEADRQLSGIDARKPWESMPGDPPDSDNMIDALDDAISNAPTARSIERSEIAGAIDFVHSEALYIVSSDVKLYLPVWTYTRVIEALREFYELVVYDLSDTNVRRAQGGGPLLNQDAEPIRVLSGSDFEPAALEEPTLRTFIEANHLSLFQTGSEKTETGERVPHDGGVVFTHYISMNKQETPFTIPSAQGRGVFIELEWSEDKGMPLDAIPIRSYVESARIDASVNQWAKKQHGETEKEIKAELQFIARLIKRFGPRVAQFAISPYDQYIQQFRDRFHATTSVSGPLYRVVDPDVEGGLLLRHKPERIPPHKDLGGTAADASLTTAQPSSETVAKVVGQLRRGDLICAALRSSAVAPEEATVEAIELIARTDVEFVESPFVPLPVRDLFDKKIGSEGSLTQDEGAASVHGPLRSYAEDLGGNRRDLGDIIIVTGRQQDRLWYETAHGRSSEEMYGGFQSHERGIPPHEAIFVNPPSEPFWYGLLFEIPRTGFAMEVRSELGIPFAD